MAERPLRARFLVECGVALLSALLFISTLLLPNWAEILFGIDVDEASGSFEWLATVLVAAVTLVALAGAGMEWRASGRPAGHHGEPIQPD
jgi:hypothetical protein